MSFVAHFLLEESKEVDDMSRKEDGAADVVVGRGEMDGAARDDTDDGADEQDSLSAGVIVWSMA